MNYVTLDKRHVGYKHGFRYGIRFDIPTHEYFKILTICHNSFGNIYGQKMQYTKWYDLRTASGIWIYFRDEKQLNIVSLIL